MKFFVFLLIFCAALPAFSQDDRLFASSSKNGWTGKYEQNGFSLNAPTRIADNLDVEIHAKEKTSAQIFLLDTDQNAVREARISLQKGKNTWHISLYDLPKGTYYVYLKTAKTWTRQKVYVAR